MFIYNLYIYIYLLCILLLGRWQELLMKCKLEFCNFGQESTQHTNIHETEYARLHSIGSQESSGAWAWAGAWSAQTKASSSTRTWISMERTVKGALVG